MSRKKYKKRNCRKATGKQKTGNMNAAPYIKRRVGLIRFERDKETGEVSNKRNGGPKNKKELALIELRKQIKSMEVFNEHQWWFIQKQIEISYTKYPLMPKQIFFILGVKSSQEFVAKYRRTKKMWDRKIERDAITKAREVGEMKDKDYSADDIKKRITNTLMDLLQQLRPESSDNFTIAHSQALKTLIEILPGVKPEFLESANNIVEIQSIEHSEELKDI